jgi:hypothetical protein
LREVLVLVFDISVCVEIGCRSIIIYVVATLHPAVSYDGNKELVTRDQASRVLGTAPVAADGRPLHVNIEELAILGVVLCVGLYRYKVVNMREGGERGV